MRPRVVVAGGARHRPPGIERAEALADLAFADDPAEVAELLPGADAVLAWRPRAELLRPGFARAARLRWIQAASAGVDGLLFPELVESDVVVTNAHGVFDGPMAEYALALLLAFAVDLPRTLELQRERRWEPRETERLAGRTLLVAGQGSIGRAVARLARAVGMRVLAVASRPRAGDGVVEEVGGPGDLPRLLGEADFVVNVLPLTERTRGLFGREAFAAMRPGARFVNLGRGGTVDEDALVEALREGRIAGAALDVFAEEPLPPDSPLWSAPNAIVSPHISGSARGWQEAVVELFLENLRRFAAGEPLTGVVDKRLGYVPSG